MKSFSYHPKVKRLKKVKFNHNQIRVCQLCRYMTKLCRYIRHKNSSKRNILKENYHLNKFPNYLLVGFTKFLDGIISTISKVKYFCGKNLSTERILTWTPKLALLAVNLETHTRKLLASYRKMKYLESNLVRVNVASLPVGKENDIGYEMYERAW